MSSNKWYSGHTQAFWTRKALLDGRTISNEAEIREVRDWRLGAIIHRLKTDYLRPIEVEYRGPENITHYWLSKDVDICALRFNPPAQAPCDKGDAA